MGNKLYCFKLDDITGKIKKYTITDFKFSKNAYGYETRDVWQFRGQLGNNDTYRYYVERNKLDRFVTNKLYTLNGDEDRAYQIIMDAIRDKADKAERDMKRYNGLLEKVMERMK